MNPHGSFRSFVHRRECLVPTWRGWLLLVVLGITLTVTALLGVHPFLAITAPVEGGVLVVEGWAPDYVLAEARTEFERHQYRKLFVTGGPLERGEHLSEYKTHAELGAATLIRMGMRRDAIEAVPAPLVRQDRTYISAVALKTWLHQHAAGDIRINVVSLGVHARRSQMLFQKAFGDNSRVGVIAVEDRDYDPIFWWKFSQGVRKVVGELVAYVYARLVFPLI